MGFLGKYKETGNSNHSKPIKTFFDGKSHKNQRQKGVAFSRVESTQKCHWALSLMTSPMIEQDYLSDLDFGTLCYEVKEDSTRSC